MKTFLLLGILFLSTTLHAAKFRDIDFSLDTTNFGSTNSFSMTVYLIKKSGKKVALLPNQFSFHWNKINVKGLYIISFKQGIVTFDQTKIIKGSNSIVLDVSYNNNEHSIQKPLTLPYVKGIIIQNSIIPVNHTAMLGYQLIFSNGKLASPSPTLFDENNFVNTSPKEVVLKGATIMMKLDEPVSYETVEISFKNKLNDQALGSKTMIIEYPTSCRIEAFGNDGPHGSNGSNGRKTSEHGTSGTSGGNGAAGRDVRVFAKMQNLGDKKFLIIQSFYSDNRHQTEVIKYEGKLISINTNGGNGGNGGIGGNGMPGLIDTTKNINSPIGGDGGNGGNAGSGGNAGTIYLVFSAESGDLSSIFEISTRGGQPGIPGNGGTGGKGDYTKTKIIGKIISNKDGKTGTNGMPGANGMSTIVGAPSILSPEEWNAQYLKNLTEGFVK